jgi:hypothetical protein
MVLDTVLKSENIPFRIIVYMFLQYVFLRKEVI